MDQVLEIIGAVLVSFYALLRGAIAARDERERRRQKRNGGTPMEHLLREQRAIRREMRAMRKTLRIIARASREQCELLDRAEKAHDALIGALNKTLQGVMLLIDRGDRRLP